MNLPTEQNKTMTYNPNGFIYICVFENGLVKVGMSKSNPDGRVSTHKRSQSKSDNRLVDFWISPEHSKFVDNENQLISFINPSKVKPHREWARNLDSDKLIEFAKGLDFFRAEDTEREIPNFKAIAEFVYGVRSEEELNLHKCYGFASLIQGAAMVNGCGGDDFKARENGRSVFVELVGAYLSTLDISEASEFTVFSIIDSSEIEDFVEIQHIAATALNKIYRGVSGGLL